MLRRRSRFSGFNARSVTLWSLAAVLASLAVWLFPSAPPRRQAAQQELVFFEIEADAQLAPASDAGAAHDAFPSPTVR